ADAELGSFAVVTIATGENFYGAPSSSIKVSEFSEFPTKGRATSGVRAHKVLKGETELSLASGGDCTQAAPSGGGARSQRTEMSRRDGSGCALESKIDVIGTLPRLGGAESIDAPSADGAGEAEDPAAEAGGASAGAGPAARGGKAKSPGKTPAGAEERGRQGLAPGVGERAHHPDERSGQL